MSLESIVPVFIILIASLSFHEAAHAWAADRLGDPTARRLGRLTLNPMAHIDWIGTVLFPLVAMLSRLPLIGWAKPVPVNMRNLRAPRRDFAVIALAGPVSNMVLVLAFGLLLKAQGGLVPEGGPTMWTAMLFEAVRLNAMLAVFNLLPVPPLDGGNVLAGFVPEPVARLIDQVRPFGILVLYALVFFGVLGAVMEPVDRFLVPWLL